jgi:hypothetical protein
MTRMMAQAQTFGLALGEWRWALAGQDSSELPGHHLVLVGEVSLAESVG